ncbi:MAG: response regulator transcription factor [Clostridia bacterium]|nr:response regulator transcription factor [Clostridia bacterium]
MSEKQRILLVDDDPNISHLVRLYLEKEGFAVSEAARGDTALETFHKELPALVLLDVMLPGLDGLQVLKEIRKTSKVPVIMLTAKDETFDKVLGLELGADDYITKPFETKELVARVKAVLRRAPAAEEKPADNDDTLRFPQLTISLSRYEVTYEGRELEMPPKELEVLYYLASHPNMVFTREQLLERVWGFDFFGDSRTVDVHIKRLREKLPECEKYGWEIHTVWRVGYKFEYKAS